MDSFTQIVLGAAVGEAVAGKKIGNKALLYGAIAGTIPDLDVFIGNYMTTVGALDFHRGFMHSIAFALIFSPLLAYLMRYIHPKSEAHFKDWFLLYFLGFFTHALLDCFTTWGTQIFWPFDYKVAFKSIFVIDPLYTLPFFACLVWVAFLNRKSENRKLLNTIGLLVSTSYLLLTLLIKLYINGVYQQSFQAEGMQVIRYDSRPAPFSTVLWAANAEVQDGYYIGYYGLLDDDKEIKYFFFPKRHDLLEPFKGSLELGKLLDIIDGWYTVEKSEEGVVLNDLRFGQRTGWLTKKGDFVFSYNITKNHKNQVVIHEVQKDFDDGSEIANALWSRIMGNE